jgi:dCTP deaminase
MFSDRTIKQAMAIGQLHIEPFDEALLQPASYEMRLDWQVLRQRDDCNMLIDTANPNAVEGLWVPHEMGTHNPIDPVLVLRPGELVLGSTMEHFTFGDKVAGCVNGKSTLGRLGLQVHATAGFVDPGFEGNITLELSNVSRHALVLRPGQVIAQMVFFRLISSPHHVYGERGNHYQGQRGPTAPRTDGPLAPGLR